MEVCRICKIYADVAHNAEVAIRSIRVLGIAIEKVQHTEST